jgi:hypothetical protein
MGTPAGGLGDAGGDLQEAEPDRRELGSCEGVELGNGVAHGEDQPVGSGVQDEPHLVGDRANPAASFLAISLDLGHATSVG